MQMRYSSTMYGQTFFYLQFRCGILYPLKSANCQLMVSRPSCPASHMCNSSSGFYLVPLHSFMPCFRSTCCFQLNATTSAASTSTYTTRHDIAQSWVGAFTNRKNLGIGASVCRILWHGVKISRKFGTNILSTTMPWCGTVLGSKCPHAMWCTCCQCSNRYYVFDNHSHIGDLTESTMEIDTVRSAGYGLSMFTCYL